MSSIRAYRYRLRLAPAQERQLARWAGQLRWIWNRALAEQQARYGRGERYASYVDMAKWLTAWRHAPDTQWLATGPMHPQQQVLKRLDEAFKRFFAKAGGYPRFKRRGQEPGMRFPDPKQFELDQDNGRVRLPKLGWVRLRLSQPVQGSLRNITIRPEGARWCVSIQTKGAQAIPSLDLAPGLGIDLGVTHFAAITDGNNGTLIEPLAALACQQRRLKRYQRSVSRKAKGSANRRKAIARLGRLHARIARQRLDWLHKLSTDLANRTPVIVIEDLKIKNMSASARGTADRPGRRVRQKAGLNRSILDAAWAEFTRQLGYKLAWRGGELIKVNPAYTSQTCRICGHASADNRKTQSLFACVACGHTEHADVHASKNILAAGHAVWAARKSTPQACGEDARRQGPARALGAASVKQEPTEELQEATPCQP